MNLNTFVRWIVVCMFLLPPCISAFVWQQTPLKIRVSAGVAEQNLIKRVEPAWPPIEKLPISGKVVLSVELSTEGKVQSIKVVSGHPMVIQAAMDAVKQWQYNPFLLNGRPVLVETIVEVPFSSFTPEERAGFEAAAKRFHEEEERCGELVAARSFAPAELSCSALPELSQKLDPLLSVERVRAYRDAGTAFFVDSKFQDALAAFQRELEIAKAQLPHTGLDMARAYADVAHGLQSTTHHEEASEDYAQAIAILERVRQLEGSAVAKDQATADLRQVLRDYALLLRQLGKESEAQEVDRKIRSLSAETNLKNQ